MQSLIKDVGGIKLPKFHGTRVLMVPFVIGEKLNRYLCQWQKVIVQMLANVSTSAIGKTAFLTIDQKIVEAGNTHRRPGAHIDGNYNEGRWETGGGSGWWWKNLETGGIIMATDVASCVAYTGDINGTPRDLGSCDHLDLSTLDQVLMKANRIYHGSVNMIHEPLVLKEKTARTLVRITLPSDYAY